MDPQTDGQGKEPQRWRQPTQWAHDLNPPRAGNIIGRKETGVAGPENARLPDRTLADVKAAHALLASLNGDELRRIPVLAVGARLEHGATYFNVAAPERGVFVANAPTEAGPDDLFVPKRLTPYDLWNRLRGVRS